MRRIRVIDSHTGGEPTRVVVSGGPDLGAGSMAERLARFRQHFDRFRTATVNEPRGSDAVVGALLCEPQDPTNTAGVIFFNNVGYLGMCGHGTIGLMVTLAYLGRIGPGAHRLETPVGVVTATLQDSERVTVANVASERYQADVAVEVDGLGTVRGDVAWGGNWFFLVKSAPLEWNLTLDNLETLTDVTWRIRQALERNEVTGRDGAEIDHIELFGPPQAGGDSRNFVLCPGKAYDRSPCGTGTSAKIACLAADGRLAEGAVWRQEGMVGSLFEGRYSRRDGQLWPEITGTAYVNADAELLIDPRDPFAWGIRH
jgi:4-hydroxyproline epimerase